MTTTSMSLWPSASLPDRANGAEDVPSAPFILAAGGRRAAICIRSLGERSRMDKVIDRNGCLLCEVNGPTCRLTLPSHRVDLAWRRSPAFELRLAPLC